MENKIPISINPMERGLITSTSDKLNIKAKAIWMIKQSSILENILSSCIDTTIWSQCATNSIVSINMNESIIEKNRNTSISILGELSILFLSRENALWLA